MNELIFKRFCQQEHISAEDFETYEEWEDYEARMKDLIQNLLTLPIREAAMIASESGWLWKRYRDVVWCIINDVMI